MKKWILKKISLLLTVAILSTCMGTVNVMAIQPADDENIETNSDYTQEPVGYNDENWLYVYETIEYGYDMLIGAYFMGEYYSYLYDESDRIVGMCNAEGDQVVKYVYDENGIVSETLSLENNVWLENDSADFIGNKNKMLSAGMFYDEKTNCYYINDRYFNPVLNKYMDGVDGIDLYLTENPYYYQTNEDGISVIAAEDSDVAATEWAEDCLASSTFGAPITNFSASWYGGLSDVEVLARAIYCEGGTAYTDEGSAVAWVIRNRVESADFDNTAIEVVKDDGEFSSITGESAAVTRDARMPATGTARWRHATYLACFLLTTNSRQEWITVIGNKLNGQLFFYAFTNAKNKYENGTCPFSGTSQNNLKYGTIDIENVYVQGYGYVTSFEDLFTEYSPIESSRNIFYDRK